MQVVTIERSGMLEDVVLPEPDHEVVPGIRMGRPDELLSPSYWLVRCKMSSASGIDFVNRSGTLAEEIGFCLLGGYGVTAELATAYFQLLRREGIFESNSQPSEGEIFNMLTEPVDVNGRQRRYRFPRQRARRIANAMMWLATNMPMTGNPLEFRSELQRLEGIGPKTASWIIRNWFNSDDVAILDIHVLRAGWEIHLFNRTSLLPRDYLVLEDRFLNFAHSLGVRPALLDAVIWSDMRTYGSQLLRLSC